MWVGLLLILILGGCTAISPHAHKAHGLKGGVAEPTYPPDGPTNCWVQPGGDPLWYPCQGEMEFMPHPGHEK
jgi:hypothetical protein